MNITSQQNFIIGDKWLYYKIYTGHKTADIILTEIIAPLTEKLIQQKNIEKWFFIRYADPKNHLRIRFLCTTIDDNSTVINEIKPFLDEYLSNKLIWNVQIDTYKRENERYGQETMSLSEELFYHDSVMIVKFIDLIEGEAGEELRWLFCLKAIDSLLDDFKYSVVKKTAISESLKKSFATEFKVNQVTKNQINEKYRLNRKKIENFISETKIEEEFIEEIDSILKEKSRSIAKTVKEIQDIANPSIIESLLKSYIHMLTNRLFKSKGRQNELVIYDFLYKYYKAIEAKQGFKISKEKQKESY